MRTAILDAIYAAMDEVNGQSLDGVRLQKSEGTLLLGSDTGVDSLTFVNFIVALEGTIEQTMGKFVVLVDEDSMALMEHPFRSVTTLVDYVQKVIDKPEPA